MMLCPAKATRYFSSAYWSAFRLCVLLIIGRSKVRVLLGPPFLIKIIELSQDGDVVDVFLQAKRNETAAKHFFRRLLRSHGGEPRKIVTDKLRSYGVAHRELIPEAIHSTKQYENNRAKQSHKATRVRAGGMRRFKSMGQSQRFVTAHVAIQNLFNLGRHLIRAQHYRNLRMSAFSEWRRAVA